jgi:hypothetical protein
MIFSTIETMLLAFALTAPDWDYHVDHPTVTRRNKMVIAARMKRSSSVPARYWHRGPCQMTCSASRFEGKASIRVD